MKTKEVSKKLPKKYICNAIECSNQKNRRDLLCKTCWKKLPRNLQLSTRKNPKIDNPKPIVQSLRFTPNQSWIDYASKYVGRIKQHLTWGDGLNAVKISD